MMLNYLILIVSMLYLKIIEEPSKKNFFILINNKTKPLLIQLNQDALEIENYS